MVNTIHWIAIYPANSAFHSLNNRAQVTSKLRKQTRLLYTPLQEHQGNLKRFWKTLKLVIPGKKKAKNIGKLVFDEKEVTEPKMTDEFCSYFAGIADAVLKEAYPNKPPTPMIETPPEDSTTSSFAFRSMSNEEVYKALTTLKTSKATGADDIPVKALKLAARRIAPSVA